MTHFILQCCNTAQSGDPTQVWEFIAPNAAPPEICGRPLLAGYFMQGKRTAYSVSDPVLGKEISRLNDDDIFPIPSIHYEIMLFLAVFEPELREYTDLRVNHSKKKPNGRIRSSTYTRIALWKYVSDIKAGTKHLPYRKCNYRFGVRGHYRHYKNGKVIFVRPYEKNKEKSQMKNTCYVLPSVKE